MDRDSESETTTGWLLETKMQASLAFIFEAISYVGYIYLAPSIRFLVRGVGVRLNYVLVVVGVRNP